MSPMLPEDAAADRSRTRRWLRVDLLVALLALLVSAVATLGTWYQTAIYRDQLSTSVWPYISFSTNVNDDGSFAFVLSNDGTGPAIIRGVRMKVGAQQYTSLRNVLHALLHRPGKTTSVQLAHASSISYGEVLRAGQEITYLGFRDPSIAKRIRSGEDVITVRVCYCSILSRCWTTNSADNEDPAPTPDCKSFDRIGIETAF